MLYKKIFVGFKGKSFLYYLPQGLRVSSMSTQVTAFNKPAHFIYLFICLFFILKPLSCLKHILNDVNSGRPISCDMKLYATLPKLWNNISLDTRRS